MSSTQSLGGRTSTDVGEPVGSRGGARAVAIGVLVALGALVVVRFKHFGGGLDKTLSFSTWVQGQLRFSYEHEFIRRGLFGEIVRRVGFPDEPRPMFLLCSVLYLAMACLLAGLAWQAFGTLGGRARLAATAATLALPFAVPDLAHELGRLDGVLYLAVLPFFVWRRPPAPVYLAVGLVGPLVHEIFVVAFLPLLVVSLLPTTSPRRLGGMLRDRRLQLLLAGCAVATTANLTVGDVATQSEDEFVAEIAQQVPDYPNIPLPPHTVLFEEPLDNLDAVTAEYTANSAANIAGAVAPLLALLWAYARLRGAERIAPATLQLAVATLPLLAMFVLGVDFIRWIALASLNALVVILADLRDRPATPDALVRAWLPLAVVATTVVLGPLGTNEAFPYARDVVPFV